MRALALFVLLPISAAASGARAQSATPAPSNPPTSVSSPTAANPAQAPDPQGQPPAYPPGPYPAYPPAPYPAYPPGPYPAPPYYAAPYNYDPQAIYLYDMQRRSPGLALLLEFLVPGVGSIYGGHPAGAAATWGMSATGVVLVFGVIGMSGDNGHPSDTEVTAVVLGLGLIIAGRIYGLVDSYSSTCEHNRTLAQQLGLPAGLALAPAPIRVGDRVAWGPALSLRF